jgi:hypothetical protein
MAMLSYQQGASNCMKVCRQTDHIVLKLQACRRGGQSVPVATSLADAGLAYDEAATEVAAVDGSRSGGKQR